MTPSISRPTALPARLRLIDWRKASLGMLVAGACALSVHVVMLQVFSVPYPSDYPSSGLPAFLNVAVGSGALSWFYASTEADFTRHALPTRMLLLFFLIAMLREALFRAPLMDAFATTAWIYSFVAAVPRLISILAMCCLVVLTKPHLRRPSTRWMAAVLIAVVVQFGVVPLVHVGFGPLLDSIAYLRHDEVYTVPYGWQIEVPAYITFLEPTIACFIVAALVWHRLAQAKFVRALQFCLLVLSLDTMLIRPFVYVLHATFPPVVALLSMGQFFLEALTLALLTAWTWTLSQRQIPRSTS